METYFDLIPKELTNVILSYIGNYESFVNLYKLTNLYINLVLTNKSFWVEYLKDRLGEVYGYIPEFSNKIIKDTKLKFYYLSTHAFRILNSYAYEIAIDTYNDMVKRVNEGIKKYYPNMTLDNIDYEKIENDGNHDNLLRERNALKFTGTVISDLSILYTSDGVIIGDLIALSDYIANGSTIYTIKLYMSFQGFSALLKMTDSSLNIQGSVHIHLTKGQYIGLLIQAHFNGVNHIKIEKMA